MIVRRNNEGQRKKYRSVRWLPSLSTIIFAMTPVIVLLFSSSIYAASPRTNYLLYCSGCHRVNGEGKPPNVPTLISELGRMVSVKEMRSYLVRIPGALQAPLSDEELADVVNWLLREFNSDTLPENFQNFTTAEVTEGRRNALLDPIKYRTEHWKAYDK